MQDVCKNSSKFEHWLPLSIMVQRFLQETHTPEFQQVNTLIIIFYLFWIHIFVKLHLSDTNLIFFFIYVSMTVLIHIYVYSIFLYDLNCYDFFQDHIITGFVSHIAHEIGYTCQSDMWQLLDTLEKESKHDHLILMFKVL